MTRTSLRARILLVLGYSAFFMFCFSLFAYWSFPYDRLRDFVVHQLKASQAKSRGDKHELSIGELGPAGFLGIAASDVTYTKRPVGENEEPASLSLDELTVKPALLSALFGTRAADFSAEAGGGGLAGSFSQRGAAMELDAELDSLDLAEIGVGGYLGVPLTGRATGTVELSLPEKAEESTGKIKLKIAGVTFGDGKAKVKIPGMRDGFTIEKLNAGELEIDIDIAQGTATINRFAADGADVVIDVGGTVRLATPTGRSRLRLGIELKFSDGYKTRDAKTKALFELMSFRPELKRASTPEGGLAFQVNGTLAVPQARPGKAPARRPPTQK